MSRTQSPSQAVDVDVDRPIRVTGRPGGAGFRWAWWGMKWLATLAVLVAITGVVAWLCFKSNVDVGRLQSKIAYAKAWMVACQVAVVISIGLFWPQIVAWGSRKSIVKDFEYDQVLALRLKVQGFLWAYLLLVPIGPANLYRLLVP
jgi:hypothetical protein